jgi:DnaK suppressor protein
MTPIRYDSEYNRDTIMDAKKIKEMRRRLSIAQDDLVRSLNRNRRAAEEIKIEKTEDEGDLATISHDRDLHYNLHESEHSRLRFIQEAIKAIDAGRYGDCVHCGEEINAKRLDAVPWATMCIRCQEEAETRQISSRLVVAGSETDEPEP